jgi:hypothetical protein
MYAGEQTQHLSLFYKRLVRQAQAFSAAAASDRRCGVLHHLLKSESFAMNPSVPRPDAANDNQALRNNRSAPQGFTRLRPPHGHNGHNGHSIDGACSCIGPCELDSELDRLDAAPASAAAARTGAAPDISVCDWDVLYGAIQTKLMLSIDSICANPEYPLSQAFEQLHVTVLECVAAMDLLHTALSQERSLSRPTQIQTQAHDALFYAQWLRSDSGHRFHQ